MLKRETTETVVRAEATRCPDCGLFPEHCFCGTQPMFPPPLQAAAHRLLQPNDRASG